MTNIKDLTLEQIAELKCLFENITSKGCNEMVGTYSIIRTHSAGVWFGKVLQKEGDEIILGEARRLYYWKTANRGISLSEVANAGLDSSSKVCEAVKKVWLQPIEIIPCTDVAIENIKSQKSFVVPECSINF